MDGLLFMLIPFLCCVAALAGPTALVVLAVKAIFGLRPGLMAGRLSMLILVLGSIWLIVELIMAMNVPSTIVDDQLYDNDGPVRGLFFMSLFVIPSAIVSIVLIWFLNRSFVRRLKGVSSAPSGAQA